MTLIGSPSYRSARTRRPSLEPLENRLVLFAATGYEWADPNVSFSFVPEAAAVEGFPNSLFSKLDSIAPTEVWQREFARALQTWANVSNLNFHEVADSGDPSGSSGVVQDNGRFGDIRLAAHELDGPLAYAYYPVSYNDLGGDIVIDPGFNYQVGSGYDLYSVLLHEAGHAIGLGHSGGSVMNSSYQGILTGLTPDDIAGVQSLYGARSEDPFDAAASNNSRQTASGLQLNAEGALSLNADLTSLADVDFYQVVAPTGGDGTLRVSVDASGFSLLAPRVNVYHASGALFGSADLGGAYGTAAELVLTGVAAGDAYYVMADGASTDEFGMGAYRLVVDFGGGGGGDPAPDPEPNPTPDPPETPSPDRYEANDSLAQATSLGRFNSKTVADATLHSSSDVDFYSFTARRGGTFQITAQGQGSADIRLNVYDASGAVVATSTSGSVSVDLSTGVAAYASVESPSGAQGQYDLVFEKSGGGGGGGSGKGGPKGGKGGKLEPDLYLADEASRDLVDGIHQRHEEAGLVEQFTVVDNTAAKKSPLKVVLRAPSPAAASHDRASRVDAALFQLFASEGTQDAADFWLDADDDLALERDQGRPGAGKTENRFEAASRSVQSDAAALGG